MGDFFIDQVSVMMDTVYFNYRNKVETNFLKSQNNEIKLTFILFLENISIITIIKLI